MKTVALLACAKASNATVFIAPQVGDNLGVGIEIGSVLEDLLSTAGMQGPAADATPPVRMQRVMVATEPSVRTAMLGAVHARWDASVRTFTDAADCCRLCAQFCIHIQNQELYGSLDHLDWSDSRLCGFSIDFPELTGPHTEHPSLWSRHSR